MNSEDSSQVNKHSEEQSRKSHKKSKHCKNKYSDEDSESVTISQLNKHKTPFNFNIIKGDKGEKGERGHTGPMGPIGPRGKKGSRGKEGAMGKTGKQGKRGPRGHVGVVWKGPWIVSTEYCNYRKLF